MKIETYKCDVCGKSKEKTNHWFAISTNSNGKAIVEIYAPGDLPQGGQFDLCGEYCVVKKVSELICKKEAPVE